MEFLILFVIYFLIVLFLNHKDKQEKNKKKNQNIKNWRIWNCVRCAMGEERDTVNNLWGDIPHDDRGIVEMPKVKQCLLAGGEIIFHTLCPEDPDMFSPGRLCLYTTTDIEKAYEQWAITKNRIKEVREENLIL